MESNLGYLLKHSLNHLVEIFADNCVNNVGVNFDRNLVDNVVEIIWKIGHFENNLADNFEFNFVDNFVDKLETFFMDKFYWQLSGRFSVLIFQTLTICIEVGEGVLSQWKGCSMVVGDSAENAKEGSKEHKFASYSIDD